MADTHSHGCTKLRAAACVTAEAAMELDAFCVDAKMEASNPSLSVLHSVQDIIQHEYALVDSIPDEDRAALMPIIRFVRNTLQDPSTIRHNLLQGCGMDVLTLNERPAMLCRQGDGMGGSGCNDMQMMPPWYASNGTDGTRHRDADHMVDMYKEWVPWQTTEACRQHRSFQGPQMQKETQDITSMCPAYGTGHPFSKPVDTLPGDYPVQPRERHDYAGCSEELHDPSSLASHKFGECHESELSSILSGMDMESFHLEELRRSLRPLCNDTGSDANDIGSVDVNNNCADGSGDEDNDDGDNESGRDDMDENDGSLLAYQHYDKASHASDVAWHSYWGNDLQYYPQPSTENLLQFPKLHCRRRNVIKKVVGWVKKRASQSFATRVRHKRRCNLPCCTDCEAGIKRRRVSGNGSKKCAKLSTIIKTSPPLAALHLEKKNNGCRQGSNAEDWKRDFSASNESSDGIEASQVTRDWADSTLTTALIIVLLDSRIRGMTAYEALQGLVQQGYSQMLGSDSRTLAAHVKTTLKECPAFKELRNHRFVLRDWQQLGMPHPAQLPNRESSSLSSSQEECSEDLTKSLGASSRIRKLCHQPDRGKLPRCRKTDGKHWRCMRNAKLGFLYCERHQQSRGRSHGHSSHKKQHPCASDERTNAAEEEMSETVVDSCSGQSIEQDTEEAEPVRCCRTDGRNWQCLNQAEEGLLYCKHHQGRCKKGRVNGQRRIGPDISENTENAPNTGLIKQEKCSPSVSRFAMQLRPRRNAAIVAFLRDV